jgi:hypothetical protein
MSRRRLGPAGAQDLAASPSLADALGVLAATPYGHDVRPGQSLAEAQHAVAETLLWNLRVFAGWVPRGGADQLRALAGWFELANVDEALRAMSGREAAPLFHLGGLATLGTRLMSATSPDELRTMLTASPWGDPGEVTDHAVRTALRLAWAERVVATVPTARRWARTAAVLLVAREQVVADRPLPAAAAASAARLLGDRAVRARSLSGLREELPRETASVLERADAPAELWRAEAGWWRRVASDAERMRRQPRFGAEPMVGTVAAAAVDAWRTRAALECAARGGRTMETFDAVA